MPIQLGSWYVAFYIHLLLCLSSCNLCLIFINDKQFLQPYVDAVPGLKLQSGQANHAWLCLDLLDVLCQLAERGHASFVQSMLEYPLKQCPEMLLLGMAHINVCLSYLFV